MKKGLLKDSSFGLAVVYVDIRHSTKIASKLNPQQQKMYYKTFLNEMIAVIEDFGGYPYKTVGDCVIGFFFEEGGFQWADSVIICGLMMIEVVKQNISPYLKSKGLPELECRVGADYGEAQIINLTGKEPLNAEVIGNVMNIAAKIQSCAGTNQMFIGQNLFELIHTPLRLCCEHKGNLDLNGKTYSYYKVNYKI